MKENIFSNKAVSELLRNVAAVYLLKNELRFKTLAYEKAADTVSHLNREIKDIWEEGKLEEVPGMGKSISAHLTEYFKKGRSKHFDSILNKIPVAVFVLMKIPTIGPKRAYKLVTTLGIENLTSAVSDLKTACLSGRVAKIDTFGQKSEKDILHAIEIFKGRSIKEDRMPLPYAFTVAQKIVEYLKQSPLIKRSDLLGSLRRWVSTIGDVDIAVEIEDNNSNIKNYQRIIEHFIHYPKIISVDNAGEKKASIIVSPNVRVDLRIQEETSYGSMLQYFTGSKEHNIKVREYAIKKGYSVSEYGIKKIKNHKYQITNQIQKSRPKVDRPLDEKIKNTNKIFKFDYEEKLYNFLGLQSIPPEIREGTDEVDLASKNQIPSLVVSKDIKGDLHIHSSYDLKPSHDLGKNTYKEIVKKAEEFGYEYVGFSDHNPRIGDLTTSEIVTIMKKRKNVIENIFSRTKNTVKVFMGLEVDILPNGKIAYPNSALDYVDYLIVSIHSVFNMGRKQMTTRVLEALKNPKVKILGHPTGRLLGSRDGYDLEWEKIFDCLQEKNIAAEINAWPERLDLPDTLVREAVYKGVKLILSSDAHANSQMDNMFYAVSVARRGWTSKNDIMNTLPYDKFRKWLVGK